MHLTPMKGKRWCLNFQVGPSLMLLAAVHVKSKDWFIALRRLGLGLLRRLGCPVKVWRVGVKGWLWCCGGSCREDRGRKRGMGRTQGEFFLISFSSWHPSQEYFSARSKKKIAALVTLNSWFLHIIFVDDFRWSSLVPLKINRTAKIICWTLKS